MLKKLLLLLGLTIIATPAMSATKTWVVIGDSIMSMVADGQAKDHALTLVSNERDVMFRSLSSPGASTGLAPNLGFNSTLVTSEMDSLRGIFNAVDGIIIQVGTNDFGANVTWTDEVASLNRILQYARTNNKKVLMLDIIWRWNEATPNSTGWALWNYRVARAMVCSSWSDVCTYAARPAAFDAPSTTLFTASDVATGTQLHPNVAGQRIYANWIESAASAAGLF